MIWFVKIHKRNVKDPLEEIIIFVKEFLLLCLIKNKNHIHMHKALLYSINNLRYFLLIYIKLIDILIN